MKPEQLSSECLDWVGDSELRMALLMGSIDETPNLEEALKLAKEADSLYDEGPDA